MKGVGEGEMVRELKEMVYRKVQMGEKRSVKVRSFFAVGPDPVGEWRVRSLYDNSMLCNGGSD